MKKLLLILLALLSLAATGPQQTQIVRVNFPDDLTEPCPKSYLSDMVFNQYNSWIQQESHGKESYPGTEANVWGYYTLPYPTTHYCAYCGSPPTICSCDFWALRADIISSVATSGDFIWADQDLVIMVFNGISDPPSFNDSVFSGCHPTSGTPIGTFDSSYLRHIIGHQNIPCSHANKLTCPSGEDVGQYYDYANRGGCTEQQYGSGIDPMGGGVYTADPIKNASSHYSMPFQSRVGWKQPSNTQVLVESKVITLTDMRLDASAVQEVRIPLPDVPTPPYGFPGKYSYSIEYRPDYGVVINLVTDIDISGIHSIAFVNGLANPPIITPSNPFYDSWRGIGVEFLSQSSTSATIYVSYPGDGGGNNKHGRGHKREAK